MLESEQPAPGAIKFARRFSLFAITVLATAAVLYLRRPDLFHRPQFWAEDAVMFFAQAYHDGAASLAARVAGYHIFPARIAAYSATFFPVRFAPEIYFGWTLFFHAALLTYLFSRRVPLPYKPLLGTAVVAAPVTNEVFLTLTNAQWFLSLGLLLLLVSVPPVTRAQQIFDIALLLLLGLCGPFVVALLPLFVWRCLRDRTRFSAVLLAGASVCSLVQVWTLGEVMAAGAQGGNDPFDHVRIFVRLLWMVFFGLEGRPADSSIYVYTVLAMLGALLYGAIISRSVRRDYRAAWIAFGGLLVFCAALAKFQPDLKALLSTAERYFYVPVVTLIWALVVTARDALWARLALAVVLGNVLFSNTGFRSHPLTDYRWRRQVRCLDRKPECVIPINPDGWSVTLHNPALREER